MTAFSSLYAILGVPPGADRATIDAAYRRLIKLHHPDRVGGDPAQAAEINRAYAILKDPAKRLRHEREQRPAAPVVRAVNRRPQGATLAGSGQRRGPRLFIVFLIVVAAAAIARQPLSAWSERMRDGWNSGALLDANGSAPGRALAAPEGQDRVAIDLKQIDRARIAAAATFAQGGIGPAADDSRDCYRDFNTQPRSALLDRCVAYDDAVAWLAGVDLVDQSGGHFQPTSLTARHIAAARQISSDFAWVEARLDRIRFEVERSLSRRAEYPRQSSGRAAIASNRQRAGQRSPAPSPARTRARRSEKDFVARHGGIY